MNIGVMAALAMVIFVEKLLHQGRLLARIVGVLLIAAASVAFFAPQIFPGLRVQ